MLARRVPTRQGIAMSSAPPTIFTPRRRLAVRQRMLAMQRRPHAARYLMDDMIEDVQERLAFLRVTPKRALVIGDWTLGLAATLAADVLEPASGLDEERPLPTTGFDFIASLGTLDTVNDLPGALVHLRNALAPGGLMIASFMGAGSLPQLRAAMLAADGERPAPRLHPMVDVRAGGQLLQRAGFADPVVDGRTLSASFRSLDGLVADLRAQGLSSVLARGGPPLTRAALGRAREAFAAEGEDGRTVERFEILTLSGWRK
jgi:SAM-dependent methyltransferase